MKAKAAITCDELADVEVECTHCRLRMKGRLGSGHQVRYFQCGSCHRVISSTYAEVLRTDAKMRAHPAGKPEAPQAAFEQVKGRLERWLAALDQSDPFRTLGVSPRQSSEEIRSCYRAQALEHHPDRGGSEERMRTLNLALEKVMAQRRAAKGTIQGSPCAQSDAKP